MKNFALSLFTMATVALSTVACAQEDSKPKKADSKVTDIAIVIKTSKGDIEATIFASKVPMTAANFLNLASRHYYDGIVFHRVIPDFMIQGGDPTGTGRGGPGYRFGDEIDPSLMHTGPGKFSMANAGPGTNGSQFFVTHKATPWLDGKHAVFGEVTKGQDVVDKIETKSEKNPKGDKIISITIKGSTESLFAAEAANLKKWNAVIDEKFGSELKAKAAAAAAAKK
ncbi:MAG: peptidyl-prolyl cis-trans isomerase B (cyclophilin B) [Verrucomicrobiales bacterium]|jgi:peptidyl-prolyl cis-trans isomerase B (cyclophilin B)